MPSAGFDMLSWMQIDHDFLQMALQGHQIRLEHIQQKMAEIQKELGTRPSRSARAVVQSDDGAGSDEAKPKRKISAAAKKRIAAAQKKRWAAFHESKGKPAAKTVVKKPGKLKRLKTFLQPLSETMKAKTRPTPKNKNPKKARPTTAKKEALEPVPF